MNQIFGIVLPVFGLIGIGYVVAWTNIAGKGSGEALADFVFTVPIPVLLFRTIALADFSGAAPWRLWLAYFTGFAVAWVAGDQIVRRLFGRDHRAGVVGGVSTAYSNAVLIGIPLTITAYGERAAVAIALIVAIHLPIAMTLGVVLIARAERLDGVATGRLNLWAAAVHIVRGLATNPLIVSLVAGLLWRLTGIALGGPVGIVVDRLAGVAGTLALISVGMTLRQYGIGRNVPAGLVLSAVKLFVLPVVVLLMARLVVDLPPVWTKIAVVAASCPTGVNAYLIANRFRTGEALASNAIAISTAIAVVTTALWLQVMTWF